MTRWQWRRVDRGWGRTKASHPANGRGRKLLWCRNRVVVVEDNSLVTHSHPCSDELTIDYWVTWH